MEVLSQVYNIIALFGNNKIGLSQFHGNISCSRGVFGVNVNDRIDILGVEVDGRRRGVKGRKILMSRNVKLVTVVPCSASDGGVSSAFFTFLLGFDFRKERKEMDGRLVCGAAENKTRKKTFEL